MEKLATDIKDEWVGPAKLALQWFIDTIGVAEWTRRRKAVADYFKSLDVVTLTEADVQTSSIDELYHPIAVYDDWIAWYMFLVESIFERPGVDDPTQSARIYPFFAVIGRHIAVLKAVPGVEDRLKEMLNQRQNKPDSTLFELAVAVLYLREGWTVSFLKERLKEKTPDFEVTRGEQIYWVECKRLAKVTDFANEERADWQKRFRHLTNAMRIFKVSAHADIIFKVPIADVPEELLGQLFFYYLQAGWLSTGSVFITEMVDFKVRLLDIPAINEILDAEGPRQNSPGLVKAITGDYAMHGSYTQLISYAKIVELGPDDDLHVLNKFVHGIHAAYSAEYKCNAASSIEKKAKDVRKVLKKAVEQIPQEREGIIHIGYETVSGPEVELVRHQKTKETIDGFDFVGKTIEAIYCHAIQPLVKVGEFECAETTLYFEKHPGSIFEENTLLDAPGVEKRTSTHWEEDLGKS